jgi:5-methyltetrahydropteroyltriglutamate--homocysteine methyltransferase
MRSTVVGNYPKLSSNKGDLNIRRQLHKFDRGDITQSELNDVFDQVTKRVVTEQVESGVDLPTDGQIRWDDIVTPLAECSEGFEIGGLIRWFDNNVYYRKPQIVGNIKWRTPITVSNYRLAREIAGREVKMVLPGPYSLVKLSDDDCYDDFNRLLGDAAALLRREVEALIAEGATQIQFDEPSLQYNPQDIEVAAEAVNSVTRGQKADFWLCFYFGRVKELLSRFNLFNVQVVAVDCVSHPENLDALLNLDNGCNACFGVIEARNIKMEKPGALLQLYEKISSRFPNAYISPSCGLEFLPHISALQKLVLLGESVKRFKGGD